MNATISLSSPTRNPILENGDRLTRAEFERRCQALPHIKKAELIEGVVYVAPPVRASTHAHPHSQIIGWLVTYAAVTPGVMVCDNATVRLDEHNAPQPDALMRLEENRGGQSRITEDDYIAGAPELIVEIAASSASYDLHDKLHAYQRNGVQEYLVWLVREQTLRWYQLEPEGYRQQSPRSDGILSSAVFPGLRLDVKALLAGQFQQVLAVLQTGLDSTAYQDFVHHQ